MKKEYCKLILLIIILITYTISGFSQSTTSGPGVGNVFGATKYLGFDATNGVNPLLIRTNLTNRIAIMGNLTTATTNAAGNINKNGFIGINTTDPWSRLHIVNGIYGACGGYRPWMREGLNIQTNDDQFWFGHKTFGNPDQQNAVINWSDDPTGGSGQISWANS